MITRYLVFITALLVTLAVMVALKTSGTAGQKKTDYSTVIKFSHAFHVRDQGIACQDCHITAPTSKLSSDKLLGNHESCQTCHEQQIAEDCAFCHVDPDNPVGLPNPDRELIFSHEQHATLNAIACETCHRGFDAVDYGAAAQAPAMESCVACHATRKVSNNCETCHRDFVTLIPADHIAGDFRRDHKAMTRLGDLEVSCETCHSGSFCQDCHSGVELRAFGTRRDLMTDPSPRGSTRDSPRQLRLQQVHDLNYRFTHAIEARSKLLDCTSCHEQQTFCAQCHEAGGNVTQTAFVPQSHREPGFTTIGKGSGGGIHAMLARRDIEQCVSCHDAEGNDPSCVLCHTDGARVR